MDQEICEVSGGVGTTPKICMNSSASGFFGQWIYRHVGYSMIPQILLNFPIGLVLKEISYAIYVIHIYIESILLAKPRNSLKNF
jgi:hypothetical protein